MEYPQQLVYPARFNTSEVVTRGLLVQAFKLYEFLRRHAARSCRGTKSVESVDKSGGRRFATRGYCLPVGSVQLAEAAMNAKIDGSQDPVRSPTQT